MIKNDSKILHLQHEIRYLPNSLNERLFGALYQLNKQDMATYEHSVRVGKLAKVISPHAHIAPGHVHPFVVGCLLHDIGKAIIPQNILKKEYALTAAEWEIVKHHPTAGANIAGGFGVENNTILEIIQYHHERWDGAGYPFGLKSERIPSYARLCSIIDAFDSMCNDRPYKKGMSIQSAKEELWLQSGKQFDKDLVQIFLGIPDEHLNTSSILWRG